MFAAKVEDVKKMMGALLVGEIFDGFLCVEAKAETYYKMSVNGRVKKEFFGEEEAYGEEFMSWKDAKEFFYRMIRGKRLPGSIRVVLAADGATVTRIAQENNVSPEGIGLYLNLQYEKGSCLLTGGVSRPGFTMDRTLENAWDAYLEQFFKQNEIAVSTHLM